MGRFKKAKGTLLKCVVSLDFSGLCKARTLAAQSQGPFRANHSCGKRAQDISLPDSFSLWLAVVRCTQALFTAVTDSAREAAQHA